MKVYQNGSLTCTLINKYDDIDYALLYISQKKEYVACWGFVVNGNACYWTQGHYFKDIDMAIWHINNIRVDSMSVYEYHDM